MDLNSDGSYTRYVTFPSSPATPTAVSATAVLSRDLPINPTTNTWARIHRFQNPPIAAGKLPLIVYFHGGGFVFMSAATTQIHDFCNRLAAAIPAVVVSVDYRLAPEHHLPAAFDDAVDALIFLKSTQDPWLTNDVDFSKVYLMGTSAGASVAYHAGLRAAAEDLEPLKISGLILHHLFLGGADRVGSELRLANAGRLTLTACDECWALALPVGSGRDHEYCDMVKGGGAGRISCRVLVAGRFGDLLIDRQMEFAKMLESEGIKCLTFYGEGDHGIELFEESKAMELFDVIQSFICSKN